jgi:hypothetical protein
MVSTSSSRCSMVLPRVGRSIFRPAAIRSPSARRASRSQSRPPSRNHQSSQRILARRSHPHLVACCKAC